jgi:hypothetical protein
MNGIENVAATVGESVDDSDAADLGSTCDDSAWLLDEEIAQLRSTFHLSTGSSIPAGLASIGADWGADAAVSMLNSGNQRSSIPYSVANTASNAAHSSNRPNRPAGIIAWAILSLGLMSFTCGGVLLAWSFLGHRNDLWTLGMPMALAGQFGLLLGLVLQLEHLWHANRRTADTLSNVDDRLSEINSAATLLQSKNGTGGQSFYMHLAENAHPNLLLADLKGQLDLLINKLSQQR